MVVLGKHSHCAEPETGYRRLRLAEIRAAMDSGVKFALRLEVEYVCSFWFDFIPLL
jgi:hypothetical protein